MLHSARSLAPRKVFTHSFFTRSVNKELHVRRKSYEHDYSERWHDDLLQGLGIRSAHSFLTWLATNCGRLGRTDAVLRAARLSRHCARPARTWALRPRG